MQVNVMSTTIQVEDQIKSKLDRMRLSDRDTYNDIIERILEDLSELDEGTKKEIEDARKQIKAGKYKTHDKVKKEFGLA